MRTESVVSALVDSSEHREPVQYEVYSTYDELIIVSAVEIVAEQFSGKSKVLCLLFDSQRK